MPEFQPADWYQLPLYYDIVFDGDTAREADFLQAVFNHYGPRLPPGTTVRTLEPACGTGRLGVELARRGWAAAGFDASHEMVAFARGRCAALDPAARRRTRFTTARMESFRHRGPFHLGFCLLSTFKYLLTEEHAREHLRRVARVLAPGGLHVIGLHLTDYTRRTTDRELWRGRRDGLAVTSEVITRPADPATRLEAMRNRLTVSNASWTTPRRYETNWHCRTYNAAELEALLRSVPELEPVACHDFTHDIKSPRGLDDTQEDLVVVLRKADHQAATGTKK